jgi:5-methylcytosine-specific restriction endonuclease McrA
MRLKICREPGCSTLVPVTETYCDKHRRERVPFANAVSTNAGLYNTVRWRALRKKVIAERPYCSCCGISRGESRLEVHHVVPPRGNEEPFFDEGNLMVVCGDCHKKITAREIGKRNRNPWA